MKNLIYLLLLAIPAAAASEYQPAATLPVAPFAYLDQVACACEPDGDALSDPAQAERLASARGKADVTPSAALDGIVSGNSAVHVTTGSNLITDGAFANMSGLPVVIQNSGANVLIQNATVINLQLR